MSDAAPRMFAQSWVETDGQEGEPVRVGSYGRLTDGLPAFAKTVKRRYHYIKKLSAYSISKDVLTALRAKTPQPMTVLVVEEDTSTVYEYPAELYFDPGSSTGAGAVPDGILHDKYDPQTYVKTAEAVKWEHHADDVFLDEEPEETEESETPNKPQPSDGQTGLGRYE